MARVRERIIAFFESRYVEAELTVPYSSSAWSPTCTSRAACSTSDTKHDGVKVIFRSDPEVIDSFRAKLSRTAPEGGDFPKRCG